MNERCKIRPIRMDEAVEAKHLIYRVAHELMEPQLSLDEVTIQWDAWGVFCDLDDIQKNYFENGGLFLVIVDDNMIVGTGAFHRHADQVCEVRRITLLPEYRGRGLGYALMIELLRCGREMGYRKMCLWTNPDKLARAVDFYHKFGFVNCSHEGADQDELWMEMEIA